MLFRSSLKFLTQQGSIWQKFDGRAQREKWINEQINEITLSPAGANLKAPHSLIDCSQLPPASKAFFSNRIAWSRNWLLLSKLYKKWKSKSLIELQFKIPYIHQRRIPSIWWHSRQPAYFKIFFFSPENPFAASFCLDQLSAWEEQVSRGQDSLAPRFLQTCDFCLPPLV